jgi:hypothetical protein
LERVYDRDIKIHANGEVVMSYYDRDTYYPRDTTPQLSIDFYLLYLKKWYKFMNIDFFSIYIRKNGLFQLFYKANLFDTFIENTSKYTYENVMNFVEHKNKTDLELFIYFLNLAYEISKIAGNEELQNKLEKVLNHNLEAIYLDLMLFE